MQKQYLLIGSSTTRCVQHKPWSVFWILSLLTGTIFVPNFSIFSYNRVMFGGQVIWYHWAEESKSAMREFGQACVASSRGCPTWPIATSLGRCRSKFGRKAWGKVIGCGQKLWHVQTCGSGVMPLLKMQIAASSKLWLEVAGAAIAPWVGTSWLKSTLASHLLG